MASNSEVQPSTQPTTPTVASHPRALVIIDVQNEFMSPAGNFPIPATCKSNLIANLTSLIPSFRQTGSIIWVRAEYPNLTTEPASMAAHAKGSNEWLAAATHVHPTPCCFPASFGAEIDPEVATLMDSVDPVVTKMWYSAFHPDDKGDLLAVFQEKGIKEAYFCGLASGTCVLATMIDAVNIEGLGVHGVLDCMGYRRESSHVVAVEKMKMMPVELVDSLTLLDGDIKGT